MNSRTPAWPAPATWIRRRARQFMRAFHLNRQDAIREALSDWRMFRGEGA